MTTIQPSIIHYLKKNQDSGHRVHEPAGLAVDLWISKKVLAVTSVRSGSAGSYSSRATISACKSDGWPGAARISVGELLLPFEKNQIDGIFSFHIT